ncbi:MAG: MFS transporter, partial [Nitriliruptoraceae bacterium]
MDGAGSQVRLGLRENLPQFALLVGVNALVGGLVGQERTVLPLLAEQEFALSGYTAMLTFIVAFGITKALVNYIAGTLADRFGRKPVLLAGWLVGLPVPLLLIWAPTWGWIVAANVLLGVNQGLAWSVTVIMKIDLVGPAKRGTAMGFNEAAGYGAVAAAAWATGVLAETYGLRPAPFFLGLAFAGLGLGLSALLVRETAGHVAHEAAARSRHTPGVTHTGARGYDGGLTGRQVFALTTWRDRSLSA